jgi:hypothetical protein
MGVVDQTRAMLLKSAANVVGHADVEAAVTSAGENVDTRFHTVVMESREVFFVLPPFFTSPTYVGEMT